MTNSISFLDMTNLSSLNSSHQGFSVLFKLPTESLETTNFAELQYQLQTPRPIKKFIILMLCLLNDFWYHSLKQSSLEEQNQQNKYMLKGKLLYWLTQQSLDSLKTVVFMPERLSTWQLLSPPDYVFAVCVEELKDS